MRLGPSRRPRRAALCFTAVAALACASREPPFETARSAPESTRRAPGVAVDPRAALPESTGRATTERGLLVLTSPPDPEAARDTVRRFFRAVVREAPEEIDRLVGAEAWVETGSQRQPVRGFWRARFAQLDYGALAHEVVYRDSELEVFRPADLERMGESRPAFVEAKPGDVIVRAVIRVSWAGRARLLGDELLFLLRPDGAEFVIAEIAEDFRLP
jgi:hypothetical protein